MINDFNENEILEMEEMATNICDQFNKSKGLDIKFLLHQKYYRNFKFKLFSGKTIIEKIVNSKVGSDLNIKMVWKKPWEKAWWPHESGDNQKYWLERKELIKRDEKITNLLLKYGYSPKTADLWTNHCIDPEWRTPYSKFQWKYGREGIVFHHLNKSTISNTYSSKFFTQFEPNYPHFYNSPDGISDSYFTKINNIEPWLFDKDRWDNINFLMAKIITKNKLEFGIYEQKLIMNTKSDSWIIDSCTINFSLISNILNITHHVKNRNNFYRIDKDIVYDLADFHKKNQKMPWWEILNLKKTIKINYSEYLNMLLTNNFDVLKNLFGNKSIIGSKEYWCKTMLKNIENKKIKDGKHEEINFKEMNEVNIHNSIAYWWNNHNIKEVEDEKFGRILLAPNYNYSWYYSCFPKYSGLTYFTDIDDVHWSTNWLNYTYKGILNVTKLPLWTANKIKKGFLDNIGDQDFIKKQVNFINLWNSNTKLNKNLVLNDGIPFFKTKEHNKIKHGSRGLYSPRSAYFGDNNKQIIFHGNPTLTKLFYGNRASYKNKIKIKNKELSFLGYDELSEFYFWSLFKDKKEEYEQNWNKIFAIIVNFIYKAKLINSLEIRLNNIQDVPEGYLDNFNYNELPLINHYEMMGYKSINLDKNYRNPLTANNAVEKYFNLKFKSRETSYLKASIPNGHLPIKKEDNVLTSIAFYWNMNNKNSFVPTYSYRSDFLEIWHNYFYKYSMSKLDIKAKLIHIDLQKVRKDEKWISENKLLDFPIEMNRNVWGKYKFWQEGKFSNSAYADNIFPKELVKNFVLKYGYIDSFNIKNLMHFYWWDTDDREKYNYIKNYFKLRLYVFNRIYLTNLNNNSNLITYYQCISTDKLINKFNNANIKLNEYRLSQNVDDKVVKKHEYYTFPYGTNKYINFTNKFWFKELKYYYRARKKALYYYKESINPNISLSKVQEIPKNKWVKLNYGKEKGNIIYQNFLPQKMKKGLWWFTFIPDNPFDMSNHDKNDYTYFSEKMFFIWLNDNKNDPKVIEILKIYQESKEEVLEDIQNRTKNNIERGLKDIWDS